MELRDMELLTTETFSNRIASVENGVCLLFKPACPFCQTMETVIQKFRPMAPEAEILAVNVAENRPVAERYKAERLPTVLIIKNGTVVSKRYGLMKPKHLNGLYHMIDVDGE